LLPWIIAKSSLFALAELDTGKKLILALSRVDRDIVITAWHALDEAEVVGVIVDAVKTIDQELKNFFKALLHWKKKKQENGEEMPPVVLILNKVLLFRLILLSQISC
jgi:hypothetical protein